MNKTALVIGCDGQDGSLICKSLLEKRYKVVGISRTKSFRSLNHQKLNIEKDVIRKSSDICDFKKMSKYIEIYQPEEIYNLAAQSSVGKSFLNPKETTEGIINGTINLLEISRKLDFKGRIFFAGSSEIFGHTKNGADLEHIQNPISPYAIGKQASFNLVKLYRNIHNLNCMTGILFNHESHLRDKNFVTQKLIRGALAIANKKKTEKIKLGNINVIRDWGWAPEYIEGIQVIANSNKVKDYVICSGKANSLKSFINKLFTYLNLNWKDYIEIDPALFRPNEIEKSYGDPSSLFAELGWKAEVDIDSLIKKLIFYSEKNQ